MTRRRALRCGRLGHLARSGDSFTNSAPVDGAPGSVLDAAHGRLARRPDHRLLDGNRASHRRAAGRARLAGLRDRPPPRHDPRPRGPRLQDPCPRRLRRSVDPPYAAFNALLARRIREAYEGPMGMFAAEPDAVARVIDKAISARRPRSRYPVTVAARVLMALRRWLPDRGFDAFLRTQFGAPAPG